MERNESHSDWHKRHGCIVTSLDTIFSEYLYPTTRMQHSRYNLDAAQLQTPLCVVTHKKQPTIGIDTILVTSPKKPQLHKFYCLIYNLFQSQFQIDFKFDETSRKHPSLIGKSYHLAQKSNSTNLCST